MAKHMLVHPGGQFVAYVLYPHTGVRSQRIVLLELQAPAAED
jgi:hypothetical protein